MILNYDEELTNSMIPNLVSLSNDVTKFKCKNSVLRKKIEMKGKRECYSFKTINIRIIYLNFVTADLDPTGSRNSWSSKSFSKLKLQISVTRNYSVSNSMFIFVSGNGNQSTFTVGTVNPMINGCVIQKPTINVRRVSFPRKNATMLHFL